MPNPFVYDREILTKKHLTKDDVLGTGLFGGGVMPGDVKCIKCEKFRVSGMNLCSECIEFMCDLCVQDGKECCRDMAFDRTDYDDMYEQMKQEYIQNMEK